MEKLFAYVDQNRDRFLDELKNLCKQPSIAAQGVGTEETADIVLHMLEGIGADARLIEVAGAPPWSMGRSAREGRR